MTMGMECVWDGVCAKMTMQFSVIQMYSRTQNMGMQAVFTMAPAGVYVAQGRVAYGLAGSQGYGPGKPHPYPTYGQQPP